jgi:putative ABC transport system permease protein
VTWILPSDFRDRFGDEIADHFRSRTREVHATRGWTGVVRFWMKGLLDLAVAAAGERKDSRASRPSSGGTGSSSLTLDVHFALRTLRRAPGFTLVALLTLALAIGSSTAMFSVLTTAMGSFLPFPEADAHAARKVDHLAAQKVDHLRAVHSTLFLI